MLKEAHEAMEKSSAVASAVKAERWGEAERQLKELMSLLDTLSNGIGDKVRAELGSPKPDSRDRG
jgi:hypothetical protein